MNFNGIEWNLELKDLEPESISYGISVKAADQIGLKSRDWVLEKSPSTSCHQDQTNLIFCNLYNLK